MVTRRNSYLALWALVCAFGLGCSLRIQPPDLGQIYDRAAADLHTERNPIVVIPGLMGSRLEELGTGRVVWGAFGGGYANPAKPDGARLVALPLDPEQTSGVVPAGVLDTVRVRLLGLPVELKAYFNILATLGAGGYRDQNLGVAGAIDYGGEHYTCFQFDYDWRLDNSQNAARLHHFLLDKKAYVEAEWRQKGIDREVRFDLVAHSMGGLLARYYLRYGDQVLSPEGPLPELTWQGAALVERAVLIGTPNAGAAEALVQLVEGVRHAPTLARYDPVLIGTFPAAYQLLQRPRHGAFVERARPDTLLPDLYDPQLWQRLGWGLASADADTMLALLLPSKSVAERRQIAYQYLSRQLALARLFHGALDRPAVAPAGTELYLIVGDARSTDAVLAIEMQNGALEVFRQGPGDGRVLRSSALADGRTADDWQPTLRSPVTWRNVLFLPSSHLGLTRDSVFSDNVLYLLLEAPRREGRGLNR